MKLCAEDKSVWSSTFAPPYTFMGCFVFSLVLGAYTEIDQLIKLGLHVAELLSYFIGKGPELGTAIPLCCRLSTLSVRTARCFLCAVPDYCFYFIFFLCHK
jgi:hypothetical protein